MAERRQVSGRQPLHHLGRLVEVSDSGEERIEGGILQQIEGRVRDVRSSSGSGGVPAPTKGGTPRLPFEQH